MDEWALISVDSRPFGHHPGPGAHHRTDEAFYVLEGKLCLAVKDAQTMYDPGAFALVRRGQRHTFWNPANKPPCS